MKPKYIIHKDHDKRINSAILAIKAIVPLDLYPAHKRDLISLCIWKITEADGKLKVRYRSEGALNSKISKTKLQHEHVHQRKKLIDRLLNGEDVETVIADAVACLVTKEEHQILDKSKSNGWKRYKESGIRVYDTKLEKWSW